MAEQEFVIVPPSDTDVSKMPLLTDMQFLDPYGSESVNRKFFGIIPPGIYRGFKYALPGAMKLRIGLPNELGTAVVQCNNVCITVQQRLAVDLTVSAGFSGLVVLTGFYQFGVPTKQVNTTATQDAAKIELIKSADLKPNQVILYTVNVPAGTTALTAAMITTARRQDVSIAVEADIYQQLHDHIASPTAHTKAQVGLGNVQNWGATASINDASDTKYATAGAVKKAYDLAAAALPKAGGVVTGVIRFTGAAGGISIHPTSDNSTGIFNGTGDGATQDKTNLQIKSWYGIGICSTAGSALAPGLNSIWVDARAGTISTIGEFYAQSSKKVYHQGFKPTSTDVGLGNVQNWGATASINDASDTKYATAGAVKKAYDLAAAAFPKAGGAVNGFVDATGHVRGREFITTTPSGADFYTVIKSESGYSMLFKSNGAAEGKASEFIGIGATDIWYRRDNGTGDRKYSDHKIYHQGFKPTSTDVGLGNVQNWGATASINDASDTKYATAGAVKKAYDLAASKLDSGANAASAAKLSTPRQINGANFDGTANITTALWGASRTLTIGNSAKTVNGSGNVSWSLVEIGAVSADDITATGERGKIPRISGSGVLEIGRHIDFHSVNTATDYDMRIDCQEVGVLNVVGGVLRVGGYDVYHRNSRPTPADIGALSSDGGTVNGAIVIKNNAPILALTETDSADKTYRLVVDSGHVRLNVNDTSLSDPSVVWRWNDDVKEFYTPGKVIAKLGLFDGTSRAYSAINKPTPADLGALDVTGGAISGNLALGGILSHSGIAAANKQLLNAGGDQVYVGSRDGIARVHIQTIGGEAFVSAGQANYRIYHQGFKPTAADVQALSLSGGTVEGSVRINGMLYPYLPLPVASKDIPSSGIYTCDTGGESKDGYDSLSSVLGFSPGSSIARHVQMMIHSSGTAFKIRSAHTSATSETGWNPWYRVYTEAFKPTAADVQALSLSGGMISGGLAIKNTSPRLDLIETDKGDKSWRVEAFDGKFAITETGVKVPFEIAAGGDAKFTNQLTANRFISSTSFGLKTGATSDGSCIVVKAESGYSMFVRENNSTTKADEFIGINPNSALLFRQDNGKGERKYVDHKVYHQGFKPTAADVGALPLTGGTITGDLTIKKRAPILRLEEEEGENPPYMFVVNGGNIRLNVRTGSLLDGDVVWRWTETSREFYTPGKLLAAGGLYDGGNRVFSDSNQPSYSQVANALGRAKCSNGLLGDLAHNGLIHVGGGVTDKPSGAPGQGDSVFTTEWNADAGNQLYLSYSQPIVAVRRKSVGAWSGWSKLYHEEFKPTKADVGLGDVNNWGATGSVSDNSDAKYATAGAVKKAYDLAAGRAPSSHFHSASEGMRDVITSAPYAHSQVGCTAMMINMRYNDREIQPGQHMTGSDLAYSNADASLVGGTPPGTWKCLGYAARSSAAAISRVSIFIRIA